MMQKEDIGDVPNSSSPEAPGDFAALDFLIVLARRKRFILRFTLGAAVVVAILTLLMPNQYTATTIVLAPYQSSLNSSLISQLGSMPFASLAGANFGIKNPAEMYTALFQGRTVEDAVIQRFGLMSRYRKKTMYDTRLALEKHATIILGVKDGLIRISIQDSDPKLAAAFANGYVDEFRKLTANLAVTEASQRRLFYQQQLLEVKEKLAAAEVAMKNTEQSTGVLQIDSQAKSLIESAAVLRGQVVAKQVQIQAMRSYATEDNPELVVAKQQLAALQEQLAKLGGAGQLSEADILVPKGRVPEAGMEYIRKLRDVKYYETITEMIARQFEMAQLDEARQGTVIQVAEAAIPPDRKSSPHRALIVLLMTMIAFGSSILWVRISQRWAESLGDPQKQHRVQTLRGLLFKQR